MASRPGGSPTRSSRIRIGSLFVLTSSRPGTTSHIGRDRLPTLYLWVAYYGWRMNSFNEACSRVRPTRFRQVNLNRQCLLRD